MDKGVLKFVADVLYVKEIISLPEYEAIMEACTLQCLDDIVEKMLSEGFNNYQSARIERKVY